MIYFFVFLIIYGVVRAIEESIMFDGDPGFGKFLDGVDEYHVYRLMEQVAIVGMLCSLIGFHLWIIGAWLIQDFIFERCYNLTFKRWQSPHDFNFFKWTVKRRWWYPLTELALGLWILTIDLF